MNFESFTWISKTDKFRFTRLESMRSTALERQMGATCSQRNPTEADLSLSVPFNRENVSCTVSKYKQWISQSDIHDSCTAEMDDVQKKKRSTKHSPFYQTKPSLNTISLSLDPLKKATPKDRRQLARSFPLFKRGGGGHHAIKGVFFFIIDSLVHFDKSKRK